MGDAIMIVIFGRPGAGKSTISEGAVTLLNEGSWKQHQLLHLDLDVCVPQWMRDNFAKGVYPTLEQRTVFISDACQHVRSEIARVKQNEDAPPRLIAMISFSFVNTDLRTAFRDDFPHAQWILVDTTAAMAQERIQVRQGHFYTGEKATKKIESKQNEDTDDNSEWEFRAVDFPHVVLDGTDTVRANAERVIACIEQQL